MGKNLIILLRTIFYNAILNNYSWLKYTGLFHRLWRIASSPVFDVRTKLFGAKVTIPSNYALPLIAREIPTFNNPCLELAYCLYKKETRKLNVADIGASVGDTFLFLIKNIPAAINRIACIEGHPRFYRYLEANTKDYSQVILSFATLSDKEETVRNLIHTHESTASAQGEALTKAQPLDKLLPGLLNGQIDIIKIDTDGFDGKILGGAREILLQHRPHIIFEYHPALILETGNELMQPFRVLSDCRYPTLLWFDKFGVFSHLSTSTDKTALEKYASDCLEKDPDEDPHYDIIALPDNSGLDITALKNCSFSKTKKRFY